MSPPTFQRQVMALAAVLILCVAAVRGQEPARETTQQRLSIQLTRSARGIIVIEPLTTAAITVSIELAREAVALNPDNVAAWRLMLDLSLLAERDDVKTEALEALSLLEPGNETVALLRISEALKRYQTIEERIRAYESLLASPRRESMRPAMASRLAFELALLHQRRGDLETFGHWLAESIALDASNGRAAALAAGFFRANVEDPYAEAELLVTSVLASPMDVQTIAVLAQLLLDQGAYNGAARMYELAASVYEAAGQPTTPGLLGDLAIAQWGRGDGEAALRSILHRQALSDQQARHLKLIDNPRLYSYELAVEQGLVAPILAIVRSAILQVNGDDRAARALAQASDAYAAMLSPERLAEIDLSPDTLAELSLDHAWVILWLGGDLDEAERRVEEADALQPLSDQARARMSGWIAFRRGDLDVAMELLTEYADQDVGSALGLAHVHLAANRRREAARFFLDVARRQPGTLLSVWASEQLSALLKRRIAVSEDAARLNQLIASMPRSIDEMVRDPSLMYSIRIRPERYQFAPFDPIRIYVEIMNTGGLPIAIDRQGVLQPQVALVPSVRVADMPELDLIQPIIIDISSKLRLAPRERLVVSTDLRLAPAAALLDQLSLKGALLSVKAVTNFVAIPREQLAIEYGPLGLEVEAPGIRLEGVDVTGAWIDDSLDAISGDAETVDLDSMVLLSVWLVDEETRQLRSEDRVRMREIAGRLTEVYTQLDEIQQTWVLSMMAKGLMTEPIINIARESDRRLVTLGVLLFAVDDLDDPALAAALTSDEEQIRAVAGVVQNTLEIRQRWQTIQQQQ